RDLAAILQDVRQLLGVVRVGSPWISNLPGLLARAENVHTRTSREERSSTDQNEPVHVTRGTASRAPPGGSLGASPGSAPPACAPPSSNHSRRALESSAPPPPAPAVAEENGGGSPRAG